MLVFALALLAAEPLTRTSLPTEPPEVAWRTAGLRLGTGYGIGAALSTGPVPEGLLHALQLDVGARLDERWSLLLALRYAVKTDAPGAGMWFQAAVAPTLHLGDLALSIGVGLGGVLVFDTGVPSPARGDLGASVTLVGLDPLLRSCSGGGVLAFVRVDYHLVVSDLLAMGPSLELGGQWTRCVESLGRADPDTGEGLELRQDWDHRRVGLAWVFWWR